MNYKLTITNKQAIQLAIANGLEFFWSEHGQAACERSELHLHITTNVSEYGRPRTRCVKKVYLYSAALMETRSILNKDGIVDTTALKTAAQIDGVFYGHIPMIDQLPSMLDTLDHDSRHNAINAPHRNDYYGYQQDARKLAKKNYEDDDEY